MNRLIPIILLFPFGIWTAEVKTWNGTTSSMNDGANWGPPNAPVSGDPLNFPPTASINYTPDNDIPGTYVLYDVSLPTPVATYSIGLTTPASGPYTLSGNAFQAPSTGSALIQVGGPGKFQSVIENDIDLNAGALKILGSGYYDLFSGVISNSGTVTFTGGSLTFSGVNTYSGLTSIGTSTSGATLRLGATNTLPTTQDLYLAPAGTLDLNNFNQTIANLTGTGIIITGTGSLAVTNSGTNIYAGIINLTSTGPTSGAGGGFTLGAGSAGSLSVTGANSYSSLVNIGSTTVNAGTLSAGSSTAFGTHSNLTIGAAGTLNANNNALIFNTITGSGSLILGTGPVTIAKGGTTFSGPITGGGTGGGLTYTGSQSSGTLTLSGANSYAGSTIISGGGTLNISNLSSDVIFQTVAGGTLQLGAPISFSQLLTVSINGAIDINGNNATWSGNIAGGGGFTLKNSGAAATLTVSGSNSYTEGTTITSGTLFLDAAGAFPSPAAGTSLSIASAGTLNMNDFSITVSTLSGSGALILGSGTLTAVGGTTGSSTNFSGPITGTGDLVFAGNGTTLILSGTNTYSGTTTINNAGILSVTQSGLSFATTEVLFSAQGGTLKAHSAMTQSIPIILNAPGVIDTNSFAVTWTGSLSGASLFTKQGSGTLTLTPTVANSYTGQTNIFGGTLQAGAGGLVPFGGTTIFDVKPNAVLDINDFDVSVQQLVGDPNSGVDLGSGSLTITGGADTSPYYGVVSGTGDLIIDSGTPAFLGTNTFTGTTVIQSGATFNTLNLGSSSSIEYSTGGGILQIGSDSISPATLVFNADATIATNTFDLTVSGAISGSGDSFTKIGQGTLTLTGANTFPNDIYLEGGILNVTSSSLGSPSSLIFQQFCGTLQSSGVITKSFPVSLSTTGIFDTSGGNITLSGNITGNGGITKTGTGTLTLGGTNTYAGLTTVLNGTLNVASIALPVPSVNFAPMVVFDSPGTGILQAGGSFVSFPTVVFIDSGTIDTNGQSVASASVVAGGVDATFTKAGLGALTLSGANIYKGPTHITGGTLTAGVASTTSAPFSGAFGVDSAVTIDSGATLALSGFDNTIKSLEGVTGSAVTLGNGKLTISSGGDLLFAGNITDGGSGGALTLTSGIQTLSGTNTFSGTTLVSSGATLKILDNVNTLGAITNNGSLTSNNLINATTYAQDAAASLSLDFASLTDYGHITASGVATLSAGSVLTITNSGLVSPTGTISLLQGSSLTGTFATVNNAFSKGTVEYTATNVNLVFSGASGCQAAWNLGASGNWGVMANWDPNTCYPGTSPASDEDTATFPNVLAASVTIFLADEMNTPLPSLTLYRLNFTESTTDYTISEFGAGTTNFIMDGGSNSNPTIAVSAGSHTINVPITLNQDSTLSLSAGTLTLQSLGDVTAGSGIALTINGPSGILNNSATIHPPIVNMTGGTVNNSGLLTPATALNISGGTVVNNTGSTMSASALTLSGGIIVNNTGSTMTASALTLSGGTLTTQNPVSTSSYIQQTAGALTLDFVSSTSSGGYGKISSTGALTLDGTLTLTNSGSVVAPTSGNVVLLEGATRSGMFSSANTSIFPAGVLTYSATQVYLDFTQSNTCNGIWTANAAGNWGILANWKTCVPGINANSDEDTATFGNVVSAPSTLDVTLYDPGDNPLDVRLNQLSFTSTSPSYTIKQNAPTEGSITFVGSTAAKINVSAGSHTIDAPITLNQDINIILTNNGVLDLESAADITEVGSRTLTVSGSSGTLINHAVVTPTNANITQGSVSNFSTFSPTSSMTISGGVVTNETGATIATPALTISGGTLSTEDQIAVTTYTQTGGALTLDFPTTSPGNILATGAVSVGGTLNITNSGAVSPTGKVILLQGSDLIGTFATVNNSFAPPAHYGQTSKTVYLNFSGCNGIWTSTSTSNDYWGLTSNWSSISCYPGSGAASDDDTATFNDVSGLPSELAITLSDSTGASSIDLTALDQLYFNAVNTNFTINEHGGGGGSITMNSSEGPALISVAAGAHTLNVPVSLGIDTSLVLTGGSLAFGSATSITGSNTLTVSGSNGTWDNEGMITSTEVIIEGGTINNLGTISPTTLSIGAAASKTVTLTNYNTISPTGAVSIDGLGSTEVVNFLDLTAGTTFTIGDTGSPEVFNTNTLSAGSSFTIDGGIITNTLAGKIHSGTASMIISGGTVDNSIFGSIYALPGQTMTISGGTISNTDLSAIGSNSISSLASSLVISGGTLTNTTGYVLADSVQISGGAITNATGGLIFADSGGMTISGGSVINQDASTLGSSTSSFGFSGGSLINSGSVLSSDYTQSGGSVINQASGVIGSSDTSIDFTGGSLSNSGSVLASNYTQSGSSLLTIGVLNATNFGSINASGSASLGGSLLVDALPGFSMSPGQTINLITAIDGLNNTTFSSYSFQNFPSSLIPEIVYLPGAVQLDIREAIPAHFNASTNIVFTSVNQHNFLILRKCFQLRNRLTKNSLDNNRSKLTQNSSFAENELYAAFNIKKNTKGMSLFGRGGNPETEKKQEQLTDRILQPDNSKPWSVYVGPVASCGNVKTKGKQIGLGYSSAGALAGFDYAVRDSEDRSYYAGFGFLTDYRKKWGTAKDNFGDLSIQKVHTSFYTTFVPKPVPELAVEGIVGCAYAWDDLHRHTGINNRLTAIGNPDEKIFDALLGIEYTFSSRSRDKFPNNLEFVPIVNLQYIHDSISSYHEHGAGTYNLFMEKQNINSLSSFLGARLNYLFTLPGYSLRTELNGGWQREYLNQNRNVAFTALSITNDPTYATAFGAGCNGWLLGVDLLSTICDTVQIEMSCDLKWSDLCFDAFFYLGVGGEF